MNYRRYRSDQHVVTGTTDNQVKLFKIPKGFVLEVTHFAAADMDTANKTLELGYIDEAGNDKQLLVDDGSQNYAVKLNGHAWIEEGETPYGKIYSPSDGDDFIVSCHGKLWPKDQVTAKDAQVQ